MWWFKKKSQPEVIELNLGENDLVVLEIDRHLSNEQRKLIAKRFGDAFHHKTNKFLVLEGGIKFKVVHRT